MSPTLTLIGLLVPQRMKKVPSLTLTRILSSSSVFLLLLLLLLTVCCLTLHQSGGFGLRGGGPRGRGQVLVVQKQRFCQEPLGRGQPEELQVSRREPRLRPPAKMAAGSEEKAHFSPERSTVGGASVPVLTPLARPERFHTFICPFSCFFFPKNILILSFVKFNFSRLPPGFTSTSPP